MKLTVLMADSAHLDPTGRVHALGLGWTTTTTPTPAMSLIVMIDVETGDTFSESSRLVGALRARDPDAGVAVGPNNERIEFDIPLPQVHHAGRTLTKFDISAGIPLGQGDYYWDVAITGTDQTVYVPITIAAPPARVSAE